jgi:hypothetical protein
VLIERVRAATTDGTGQYKIIDLRPGTYSVTFTLTGFNGLKRDNVELTGSSTATVNADMTVGSVAETVTVTGEAPSVDVQNTARSTVITSETQSALASGRSQYAYAALVPGVTLAGFSGGNTQDVGGTGNMDITIFTVHGSRPFDNRLMINGLTARNLLAAGWASNFVPDMGASAEVTYDYSSGTADSYGSGFSINLIPKEGGNSFRGSIFATGVNGSWQSDNYSADLQALGLSSPNKLKKLYDINPSIGGPIVKDRAWFFYSMRWQESTKYFAGAFENANLGDPTRWDYVPDLSEPGIDIKRMIPTTSVRLTWQATPRNKIGFSTDPQSRYWQSAAANQAPEVYPSWSFQHESFTTATYSSPITNKLLLDARFGNHAEAFVDDCVESVSPACAGYGPSNRKFVDAITVHDLNTNFRYHGNGYSNYFLGGSGGLGIPTIYGSQHAPFIMQAQASLSYVTGSHAMKFGWQDDFGHSTNCNYDNSAGLLYLFGTPAVGQPHLDAFGHSLVPVSLEQHALPICSTTYLTAEMGIYAQDKWTVGRATINGGLRFDYFKNKFPAQHLGPSVWTPNRDVTLPETEHYDMKDLTPRVGVVYDLTGDGKTAVKASWGKYMAGGNPVDGNPIYNISNVVARSWTPSLPFGHPNYYTPQCDLHNPNANGDCGAINNSAFGQVGTPSLTIDPATYTGWGHRFWSQEFSASIQREILPRVSADFGYFRRWYGNFLVVDNRAVTPADFTQYSIIVPNDARLPRSGQVLGGFYEVNPALANSVDAYQTFTDKYGNQQEHWNGFDLTVNARPRSGVTLQGGLSWGRLSADFCEIEAALPETQTQYGILAYSRDDCRVVEPFQTQFKMLGTYLIPKVDVQFGVTFQSAPGHAQLASYFQTAPQAGLPSLSGAGVRLIQLIPQTQPTPFLISTAPTLAGSSQYYPRANQLDFRVSKIFRLGGRYRATVNFDMANALNANDVLAFNQTYGPAWTHPLNIMDGRLMKLSGQFDF